MSMLPWGDLKLACDKLFLHVSQPLERRDDASIHQRLSCVIILKPAKAHYHEVMSTGRYAR